MRLFILYFREGEELLMSKIIARTLRCIYGLYIFLLYSKRNKNITLISNNCIAGYIYHDVRGKFYSPTINLQIAPVDYVKFVNNMDFYLNQDLVEIQEPSDEGFKKLGGEKITFPVGRLGDIIIYFQHYKNFTEAKSKWESRKERIIADNIVLLLVDTFCTQEILEEYSNAPFRKIFLSNDARKKDWITDGTFLKYDSTKCTEWYEIAKTRDNIYDLLGRRYFEKTDIFHHIFR